MSLIRFNDAPDRGAGGAGTHTGHTDHTDEPHNHPDPPTHTPHRTANRGADPGADRCDRTPRPDSEDGRPLCEPAALAGTVTADDRNSHRRRLGRGAAPRLRVGTATGTGKKTQGGAGTHTWDTHGHTGRTGAHGHTDHTDKPHNHLNTPTHPHARSHDDRDRYR